MAVVSLPILWVNHLQEAAFMGFITIIWLFLNIHERIWNMLSIKKKAISYSKSNNGRGLLHKNAVWYRQPGIQTWMKQNYEKSGPTVLMIH